MQNKALPILFVIFAIATIAFIPYIYIPNFEETKCPFCYGKEFCNNKNVTLRMSSISDIINNLLSVKNVHFTTDGKVLKKLGHTEDLNVMDHHICASHGELENCELNNLDVSALNYEELLRISLKSSDKGYKICGGGSIDTLLKRLLKVEESNDLINLWTISLINFEPLFYKVFKTSNFKLPTYYGACGRVIAVENCGKTLNEYQNYDWFTRAVIARSIIDLTMTFTEGDDDFRIYLTDVSPDNIAVDEITFIAKFVDFGNVILVQKTNVSIVHKSQYYNDVDGFSYIEEDICRSSISDHNIYSICKLLLSRNAPWPMMKGGLLHSIPHVVQTKNPQLIQVIESCVKHDKFDRFASIAKLDDMLKDILNTQALD